MVSIFLEIKTLFKNRTNTMKTSHPPLVRLWMLASTFQLGKAAIIKTAKSFTSFMRIFFSQFCSIINLCQNKNIETDWWFYQISCVIITLTWGILNCLHNNIFLFPPSCKQDRVQQKFNSLIKRPLTISVHFCWHRANRSRGKLIMLMINVLQDKLLDVTSPIIHAKLSST